MPSGRDIHFKLQKGTFKKYVRSRFPSFDQYNKIVDNIRPTASNIITNKKNDLKHIRKDT